MSASPGNDSASDDPRLARYARQMRFDKIGVPGQRRLAASRVTLIGCGALGSILAETMVRAGVGFLRICDRDFIERDNLQRQVLFDEDDIAANLPKAEAARAKLARINSEVAVEGAVVDVNPTNIEGLCDGADLLLDGTDNFETRFLLNDVAVKHSVPWVYGAVIGASGLVMAVLPHDTPCLRCVFEDAPPPEFNPTCDTAGVLGPAVGLVAGWQALEALKLLTGRGQEVNRHLLSIDGWSGRVVNLDVQRSRDHGDCPCCKQGQFAFLSGQMGSTATTLCGRDAVQINVRSVEAVDFPAIAEKLKGVTEAAPRYNRFMLRAVVDGCELVLFPDGRAIFKGTDRVEYARALYARYIGA